MVNLHFLSLMEALLECRSTILAKLMPLWCPVLHAYNTTVGNITGTYNKQIHWCKGVESWFRHGPVAHKIACHSTMASKSEWAISKILTIYFYAATRPHSCKTAVHTRLGSNQAPLSPGHGYQRQPAELAAQTAVQDGADRAPGFKCNSAVLHSVKLSLDVRIKI